MERPERRGWVVLAVVSGGLCVVSLLSAVLLLITTRWMDAGQVLVLSVGTYWIAAGAWLRSPRGHVGERTPPPPPPGLSARHAEVYVVTGVLCVIACLIALGLQAVAADL